MNEVTRIHLGRQPFTISVDAHRELRNYLSDIQKKVADKDVANEVELRMSELLVERGIVGEKVVLSEDIEYLKGQLGTPEDFGDEDTEPERPAKDESGAKRLFRDTDNAMVAGVAAGLASYFGLDVVLIRIVFALLTFFGGGSGILLYLILWFAVPPAVSASEKLQMQGISVTLEALKESVSKADVPATARRINNRLLSIIDGLFRLLIKLIGASFIIAGVAVIMGAGAIKAYMLLHDGRLFEENLFPVGFREQWLLGLGLIFACLVAVFLILAGITEFKRRWPLRSWATGIMGVLLLATLVLGGVLAADAVPRVRDRYESAVHTAAVKDIKPFDRVETKGGVRLEYISSPDYAVKLRYFGNPDVSKIKLSVKDDTLYVDATGFDNNRVCEMICLFPDYGLRVQIHAPNIEGFEEPPVVDLTYPGPVLPALPSKSI